MKDDERSLVDNIILGINGGIFDHYLKAIVDASIARKRVLSQQGSIPSQFRIALTPKPPVLDEEYEEDDEEEPRTIRARKAVPMTQTFTSSNPNVIASSGGGGTTTLGGGSGHITISSGKPQHTKPFDGTPVFNGRISPLTTAQQRNMDEDSYVILHGFAYSKRDFYGKVVQVGDLFGVSDQRVMIIGIGKKQLKVLYVNEPPQGTLHGENPNQKWRDVEEDFFDRSYVDDIIAQPPYGHEDEYTTT